MNVQTPLVLTITVYQGHKTEGFTDLVPLAAVEVERWYMAPGVRRVDVTEDGLSATLFLPPGSITFCGTRMGRGRELDRFTLHTMQCVLS